MSIAEVAKLAGVSNATISRVINARDGVSASTTANVRRAIEMVGYEPDGKRRRHRSGPHRSSSAKSIVFLVFGDRASKTAIGFQRLVAAASSQLADLGASLSVKYVIDRDDALALDLSQSHVDGVLAAGRPPDVGLNEKLYEIPTVWLMGNPSRPTWGDQVMPCNLEIGRIAASYLQRSGCNRLAYINLLPNHWALRQRGRAFIHAAQEIETAATSIEATASELMTSLIDTDPAASDLNSQTADALVDELMRHKPRIDGAFIAEDVQTAILLPAMRRRGMDLTSGDGLTLISCNNERPYLMGLDPCPPTIDICFETIGRRGAAHLIWRIDESDSEHRTQTTVEPQLVPANHAPTNPRRHQHPNGSGP